MVLQLPVGLKEGDPDTGQEKLSVSEESTCLPTWKPFRDAAVERSMWGQ